jgi:hypothetical protein
VAKSQGEERTGAVIAIGESRFGGSPCPGRGNRCGAREGTAHGAEKVRNSTTREGAPKFTGAVWYKVIGSIQGFDPATPEALATRIPVRHALGTEDKHAAQRLVEKIDSAYVSGPDSPLWPELKRILPRATFKFFADRIRYQDIEAQAPSRAIAKPTWADLRLIFEADMARRVERYRQGELKDILAPRTEKHYKEIMDCFEEFLQNENTLLTDIRPDDRAERRKKAREQWRQRAGTYRGPAHRFSIRR